MAYRYTLQNDIEGVFVLPFEPRGWDELETAFVRQPRWHGIFLTTKTEFAFSCLNGFEFVFNVYETQGVSGIISILIEETCAPDNIGTDYAPAYSDDYGTENPDSNAVWETVFIGRLDLRTFRETTIDGTKYVSVVAEPIDEFALVNNDVDTEYNVFSKDTTLAPQVFNFHGKEILKTAQYDQNPEVHGFNFNAGDDGTLFAVPYVAFVGGDGLTDFLTPVGPFFAPSGVSDGFYQFAIDSVATLDYNFKVRFNVAPFTPAFGNMRVLLEVNGFAVYTSPYFYNTGQQDFHIQGSVTSNVLAGSILTVHLRLEFVIDFPTTIYYSLLEDNAPAPTSTMKLSTGSVFADTVGPVVYAHELLNEVIRNILKVPAGLESSLIGRTNSAPTTYPANGDASFTAFCTGVMIRDFPVYTLDANGTSTSNVFSVSLSKLLSALNTAWCIGMDVRNGKVRIEKRKFFYDETVLFQLPNVLEIDRSVATEYIYNNIVGGFDKSEITIVNGYDEVNTKRNYTTEQLIINEYPASTSVVCSAYAIEETREQQFATSGTTQSNYDKEVFMIATRRDTGAMNNAEKAENFSNVTGIYSPNTTYNLRYSPTRNIIRHAGFIFPSILKAVNKSFKITNATGNISLIASQNDGASGNYSNAPLVESQDILLSDPNVGADGQVKYIPEYFDFRYPLTKAQYQILINNPYGVIEFSNSDSDFIGGFIVNLSYNRISGLTDFKLLRKA